MLHLLLLLLLLVCSSQASHFYGTVMTYYPKNTHADGSVTVVVRYKSNSHSCTKEAWTCLSGNCGNESLVTGNIDEESGAWCQTEGISTRLVPSNAPFQLVVPSNCLRDFNLLAFDPDGDEVKCRYGNDTLQECNPCTPPSVLNLSSSCTLSFSPTSSSNEGAYVVQLVMEDFPRETIKLIQTNGSQEVKTTSNAISKIPVQFALKVDPVVPSCTEGIYLPKFLPPTPANRAQLYTPASQTLEIRINAQANNSTISELLFSGPHNIDETTLGTGQFILRWTPSESENGKSYPVCFVVQAKLNSAKYHSEFRCVIVTVGTEPITTTPTKSTTIIPSTTTPQKTTTFSWTTTPQTTTPNDISTTQSSTNVPSTTASATTFSSTTTPQTTTPNDTSTTQSLTNVPSTTASATNFSSTTAPQTATPNNTSTTQSSTNVSSTTASATNFSSATAPQTATLNNTSTTQTSTNVSSTTATNFSSTTTTQITTPNNTSTTQSLTNIPSTTASATTFSSTTTPQTTTPNDTSTTQSSTNVPSTTASATNFSSATAPQTATLNNTSTTQTSTNVSSTTATNFSSTTTTQITTPNNTSTTQSLTNIPSTTASATTFSSTTTPQTTTPNDTSTTQSSTNVPSTTASATNFSSATAPQTATPNNTSITQSSTSPHSVAKPQDTTLNISNNFVVGLNMRISSSSPLSEDYIRNTVIQQLKDELVRRGLPSDISLRLVSSMKLEVSNTTAGGSL
ncbi:mucin-5AC-like isoform X2 [Thunnus maccoyii]|uniref:mucin-5AC-like isoform X2 n=1 Tax=Thunnus maccoyii TaxID=8240 RepID=UPI001C4D7CB0|nr:mucin-5AC-like isoform X2 [Thunnus maccoyii]